MRSHPELLPRQPSNEDEKLPPDGYTWLDTTSNARTKNFIEDPNGGRDNVHGDKIVVEKYGPGTPEENFVVGAQG